MSYYLTSLLHPAPPLPKSYTDIMFVCSSVAMATTVSVGGRHVMGQSQVSQSTFLCLCRSRLTFDPYSPERETQSSCSGTINVSWLYRAGRLLTSII